MNIKILFLGTPDFVIPIKKALAKNFISVKSAAKADLLVVAAYGKILPKEVIEAPKFGSINVHPSLLPKYRGASPIQKAILEGDKTSGLTILKMDEKMDHGPIIYQETLELNSSDNFDILSKKMFLRAADVLPQIIRRFITGVIKPKEQNHSQASFCKLIKKEDGFFDINNPPSPKTLDRMIRAYYPWPTAWTRWNGKIVKFLPEGKIQMEGKKAIPLNDFLNGYPDFPLKYYGN